jgi:Zn-finger protein
LTDGYIRIRKPVCNIRIFSAEFREKMGEEIRVQPTETTVGFLFYMIAKPKRVNAACKYFPCHRDLEDCTFCFCPFYPCLDEKRGEFVYSKNLKKKVWSCQNCSWIHSRKVTDKIFSIIRTNKERINEKGNSNLRNRLRRR